MRRTASDADVTWPYKIDPALTPSENELVVATRLAIAAMLEAPAEVACRALVDAAYAAGSRDNISAIVVRVCA